ncbi:S9 family peptidase [Flavobacterium ginsenosidimutans]|uniref:DPP IV N-terminal domain-containing protein n=1 Tax=Flavobacterium ginsenosidimutans TaxID=687844 RepID=A0ABZ2QF38_9FLAO|nr:DPP IV N-terminal domain-containing protein [Flavobacterium ginsenosidimutans]KAF2330512.1 prolyl oligopeptidase family serine peptidase [Flavobacterium ginsenosidimutans]
MKKTISLFFFLIAPLFFLTTNAQNLKWANNNKSYYTIEKGEIIQYELPNFTPTKIVDTKQLTAKGSNKALDIKDFEFSKNEKLVLIYTNSKKVWRLETRGDYWILNLETNELHQIGKSRPESSLMFAKLSPDNSSIAYVSNHNLYVEDLNSGKATALTTDGTDRLINGTFDWAYEEEFNCRDGFRWSPDGKSIAFWQIDATKIKNFLMINNTDSIYSYTIPVEYPKAGQDPSACKVGVVNIASLQTTWMNVPGDSKQHYIPLMQWTPDGSSILVEQLNRKQNEAKLFLCNPKNGEANQIYSEKNNSWIDILPTEDEGWKWINSGKEFLSLSEKDGWRHLYRISKNGKESLVSNGKYDIIEIKAVDEKSGFVYFLASPENATQQYLYKTLLNGKGKLVKVSPVNEIGTHNYQLSPDAKYAQHKFSNHKNERKSEWVELSNQKVIKKIDQNTELSNNVEMIQITTADNITLDGWMIKPTPFDETKKYPVLFYVYTEPAGATVKDAAGYAGTFLYNGDIAADGYIQISLDGRGTPVPKGAAWRKSIYQNIGIINVRDQAMAAKEILKWPFVDQNRIAVWGWSGGGSTTLNLLFQYPEIYKTGIAIAAVPNQLLYDNIYQERYMGLPQENKEPFIKGSPITYANKLQGNLLLVHGTGDDNVHYQGAEMLVNELVKNGKQFQMMSYPNRTHSIDEGEGTSEHLSQLFTQYLKEHCPGGGI